MLLKEIEEKKKELIEKSSNLEQILYSILSGRKGNIEINESDLNNIEKIALFLLKDNRSKIESLIKKEQKTDSDFQFHYSKNLLELTIMSLADAKFEQKNILKFLKTKGLKEAFVLSFATKSIDLSKQTVSKSKIDNLINQFFIKKDTSNFAKYFAEALLEVDELIEIFVIEKCYEYIIDFHPVPNAKRNTEVLLSAIEKYNDKIELKIKRRFFAWAFIILICFVLAVSFILPQYWESQNLEPIVAASQIISSVLFVLLWLYLALFKKIEDKFSLITNYIEKKKRKINQKVGIDLAKIEEIKDNQNE